jgi:hypothetical protein
MANRTIQFLGQGYAPTGTEPIVITATLNGNVVYTGNIPTTYTTDVNRIPEGQEVLFTCELPIDYAGTMPMSISLDNPVGVTVYFEQINSNYLPKNNPVYNTAELSVLTNPSSTISEKLAIWTARAVPALDSTEIATLEAGPQSERIAVLAAHNLNTQISNGPDVFYSANNDLDTRSNVVINGVAQTRGDTPSGTWGWEVTFPSDDSGSIEYDLTVVAGLE